MAEVKRHLLKLKSILVVTAFALATGLTIRAADRPSRVGTPDGPLRIEAAELASLNFDLSAGGLPIAPGLETFTVCRSDKEHPEAAEGLGWTYQHHPDIAAWHGRLYVGWNSCERDETFGHRGNLSVPPSMAKRGQSLPRCFHRDSPRHCA